MLTVSMEPVTWALRIHPEGGSHKDVSKYENSSTVTADDDMVATIRGFVFDEHLTVELRKAIFVEMARWDIKEVIWSRREPGKKPRKFRHKCP